MMFQIGNAITRSSSSISVVVAPVEAYINAHPWWVSFFSLTLLVGTVLKIPTRMVPGICPYRPIPNIIDYYEMQQSISSALKKPGKIQD